MESSKIEKKKLQRTKIQTLRNELIKSQKSTSNRSNFLHQKTTSITNIMKRNIKVTIRKECFYKSKRKMNIKKMIFKMIYKVHHFGNCYHKNVTSEYLL